jgi:hypothetical protein
MRLDKAAYLALASFTGFIIILVVAFGTYGSNISKDTNFIMFFKWYIFLFVFNLLNIMVTLIFHYMMADIPGTQGLKGYIGDKGLAGESDKCFCTGGRLASVEDSIQSMDINRDIQTREVTDIGRNRVGTLIYHDDDDDENTPLIVGREQYAPA